jgi:hypothetical protein
MCSGLRRLLAMNQTSVGCAEVARQGAACGYGECCADGAADAMTHLAADRGADAAAAANAARRAHRRSGDGEGSGGGREARAPHP